ncbi:MAG: type II secretion system inner membrane protein GspF [Pseudomonadota bacterium]
MGAYEFQALDGRGRAKRGVLQGDTARQVRQQLREQGLNPLAVQAVIDDAGTGPQRRGSIAAAERALILRQLAGLVAAGLPLEESLDTVAEQSEKNAVRRIIVAVRSRVIEGRSLSEAMGEFPRAFPALYAATIAAGEQSGRLDTVLHRLADYAEDREQFSRKTWLALVYPALLALVAFAVVIGLMAYVVPQVTVVFESFDTELPLLTRALMATSAFLETWGLWLALGGIALIIGAALALRSAAVRAVRDRALLTVPLIGRLARAAETARFVRTLEILVGSAVPLLEALGIAARVTNNSVIQNAVREVAARVREGASLSQAMGDTGRFPPLVTRLIAGGEKSGSLEQVLDKAAEIQEREVETASAVFTAVLEPLLILAVGGMVLLIVLAILLPIFQLNQLLR